MVDKNDVAAVVELIRPSLQADGGDVRFVDVDEDGRRIDVSLPAGLLDL